MNPIETRQTRNSNFRIAALLLAAGLPVLAACAGAGPDSAGVWVCDTETQPVVRRDLTRAAFDAERDQLAAAGFQLTDVELQRAGAGVTYAGVWHQGAAASQLVGPHTWNDLLGQWNQFETLNLRMIDLETFVLDGQRQFLGLAREGWAPHTIETGLSTAQLQAEIEEGDNLLDEFEGYFEDGSWRFAAVFVPGPGRQKFVAEVSLDELHDEFHCLGGFAYLRDFEFLRAGSGTAGYAGLFRQRSVPDSCAAEHLDHLWVGHEAGPLEQRVLSLWEEEGPGPLVLVDFELAAEAPAPGPVVAAAQDRVTPGGRQAAGPPPVLGVSAGDTSTPSRPAPPVHDDSSHGPPDHN